VESEDDEVEQEQPVNAQNAQNENEFLSPPKQQSEIDKNSDLSS
jgi:hypothetical protein